MSDEWEGLLLSIQYFAVHLQWLQLTMIFIIKSYVNIFVLSLWNRKKIALHKCLKLTSSNFLFFQTCVPIPKNVYCDIKCKISNTSRCKATICTYSKLSLNNWLADLLSKLLSKSLLCNWLTGKKTQMQCETLKGECWVFIGMVIAGSLHLSVRVALNAWLM